MRCSSIDDPGDVRRAHEAVDQRLRAVRALERVQAVDAVGGDVPRGRAQGRLGDFQGPGAAAEGLLGVFGGRSEHLSSCRLVEPACYVFYGFFLIPREGKSKSEVDREKTEKKNGEFRFSLFYRVSL